MILEYAPACSRGGISALQWSQVYAGSISNRSLPRGFWRSHRSQSAEISVQSAAVRVEPKEACAWNWRSAVSREQAGSLRGGGRGYA
jgi:hypothetical protein